MKFESRVKKIVHAIFGENVSDAVVHKISEEAHEIIKSKCTEVNVTQELYERNLNKMVNQKIVVLAMQNLIEKV